MIEYETFIYLDVYRTGSSHIINLLPQITGERMVLTSRHGSLTKPRWHGYAGGKLVFASVRNPWDWYVSLWAYGADGKSAIRRYLKMHASAGEVAELYNKAAPEISFRKWLRLMHDPSFLNTIMQEHMPASGLAGIVGLYTYRYLRVTTRYPKFLLRKPFIGSIEGALRHHRWLKSYSLVVHNERLSEDLIALIAASTGRCSFRANAGDIIRDQDSRPRNASGRTLSSYRDYYDRETSDLVGRRDRFFTDEFGYSF